MSNYFEAVSALRRTVVGANAVPASPTKQGEFQAIADLEWSKVPSEKRFAMIVVEDSGKARVFVFDDIDTVKAAFEAKQTTLSGSKTDAFVAWYDRQETPQMMDLSFRPPRVIENITVVEKEKVVTRARSFWPWILGGTAGIVGVLIATRKRGSHV